MYLLDGWQSNKRLSKWPIKDEYILYFSIFSLFAHSLLNIFLCYNDCCVQKGANRNDSQLFYNSVEFPTLVCVLIYQVILQSFGYVVYEKQKFKTNCQ